jgi:hypothetical protein
MTSVLMTFGMITFDVTRTLGMMTAIDMLTFSMKLFDIIRFLKDDNWHKKFDIATFHIMAIRLCCPPDGGTSH